MKNIVGILDQYRIPLLSRPHEFKLLMCVFRTGSATVDELVKQMGESRPRTEGLLQELYRASWLRTSPQGRYFTTERSEALLDMLGLQQTATESLLREFLPREEDRERIEELLKGHWAWNRHTECRRAVQVAHWSANGLPYTDEDSKRKSLELVLLLLYPDKSLTSSLGEKGQTDRSALSSTNLDTFKKFLFECKLPADKHSAETTMMVFVQLTAGVVLFDLNYDMLNTVLKRDDKYLERLWGRALSVEPELSDHLTKLGAYLDPSAGSMPKVKASDWITRLRQSAAAKSLVRIWGRSEEIIRRILGAGPSEQIPAETESERH